MKSEVSTLVRTIGSGIANFARTRIRVLDYVELMKPELTFLSVLTTLCGFYLAVDGQIDGWLLFHTAMGTALVGGGAGALNQYMERAYDALMRRTERRPLPAGRLLPVEGMVFGIACTAVGIGQLFIYVNVLTASLAALTFATYLFLYTPLKRVTPYATLVGGIPGALPPMMGWTAVRNEVTIEAWILFAILFCWQMPHFLSLAWMYRKDYARAGFKILSVVDPSGKRTSRHILLFCAALIPASGAATALGLTGPTYLAGGLVLGMSFLVLGVLFAGCVGRAEQAHFMKTNSSSRRIFLASLLYLPALMLLMMLDKV